MKKIAAASSSTVERAMWVYGSQSQICPLKITDWGVGGRKYVGKRNSKVVLSSTLA